jgi:class 3 adenylate cyclase
MLHTSFMDVFKAIPVPTTVIHMDGSLVPPTVARAVIDMIEDAELIQVAGSPPGTSVGEAWQPVWDRMITMATGTAVTQDIGRFLGAVLFTDVVDSTRLLAEIGDARYRELRDTHERQVRLHVERDGGRLMNVIGDGTFSVFDGPSRAVQSAQAICAQAADLGIGVRAGVHSGELERTSGHDVTGLTVHVGARVAGAAGPGQVLVSRTVRDLALGSGLHFEPWGKHELKGVPGTWELFSVGEQRSAVPIAEAPSPTVIDRAALRIAQRSPRLARGAVAAGNAWQRRRAKAG